MTQVFIDPNTEKATLTDDEIELATIFIKMMGEKLETLDPKFKECQPTSVIAVMLGSMIVHALDEYGGNPTDYIKHCVLIMSEIISNTADERRRSANAH